MRILFLVVFVGLCALVLSEPIQQSGIHTYKVADQAFLDKQKRLLELFKFINQPSYKKELQEIAQSFKLEDNKANFNEPEIVSKFLEIYTRDFIPKGHIFSVFNQEHLNQSILLFDLFYNAKDFETFYKTAVCARNFVNEGLFLYALSVAIVHREDTYGIVLPPIYEVYPHYFFNNEVIQKAQIYKQIYQINPKPESSGYKGYTINSNYSGWYLNLNSEQALSYFTEDIGINAFYYYFNIYYPSWLPNDQYYKKNDRRGEQFYYVHQQLLARYYLERLSNGFGEIKNFDYDYPIETGFYPSLRYPNGLEFPERPSNVHLYRSNFYGRQNNKYSYLYTYAQIFVKDYERRIRDAIDFGYIFDKNGVKLDILTPEGVEILGNIFENNENTPHPKYYGPLQVFARYLLGYSYHPLQKYQLAPSALEHYETSLRDPVFYQFFKRIILYFQKYKNNLPKYVKADLYYPGIRVESFSVDKLLTYFERYDSDISNAVYINEQENEKEPFQIRVRQRRLNHKPFSYQINVNSIKATDAVVRVFIGPKYDEYGRKININANRLNFVELERFFTVLKAGSNVLNRRCEYGYYTQDRTSYKQLYQQVLNALEGKEEFRYGTPDTFYGFPKRFLLPKGSRSGTTYQFYVIVSPYKPTQKDAKTNFYPSLTGGQFIDTYPLGYPFDRPIREIDFFVPNSYFKDVVIYHRSEEEINASNAVASGQ